MLRNLLRYYLFIDMVQQMNGIFRDTICYVWQILLKWKTNSCFVYFFADKQPQLLAPLATLVYYTRLQSGQVNVVKKPKCDVRENKFYGLISIKNIFNPFIIEK